MRAEFRPHDVLFLPIPVTTLIAGLRVALGVIEQGQAVLVHCQRGRHRSVALAAAILIAHGHSSTEAMRLLRQQRAVADPHLWYIRSQIEKFEKQWKKP